MPDLIISEISAKLRIVFKIALAYVCNPMMSFSALQLDNSEKNRHSIHICFCGKYNKYTTRMMNVHMMITLL